MAQLWWPCQHKREFLSDDRTPETSGYSNIFTGNLITMLQVKKDFFSRAILSTSVWHHVFSQCLTVKSLKFQKLFSRFFMMSEARWTTDEILYSLVSIVIKLLVMNLAVQWCPLSWKFQLRKKIKYFWKDYNYFLNYISIQREYSTHFKQLPDYRNERNTC